MQGKKTAPGGENRKERHEGNEENEFFVFALESQDEKEGKPNAEVTEVRLEVVADILLVADDLDRVVDGLVGR